MRGILRSVGAARGNVPEHQKSAGFAFRDTRFTLDLTEVAMSPWQIERELRRLRNVREGHVETGTYIEVPLPGPASAPPMPSDEPNAPQRGVQTFEI